MFGHLSEFFAWFSQRCESNPYKVTPIPLQELRKWGRDPNHGNFAHTTGKFFAIHGLTVSTNHRDTTNWQQPIISQPEIGILGLLVKKVENDVFFLMQAKMEPGNINGVQLSPTVQATPSNYNRVHGGNAVPYLEYFIAPRSGRILFDALQSEQGSWFLRKRNRNMIIEVSKNPPLHDNFCWLSLKQISELLAVSNLVNMDSRTVLSGMPDVTSALLAPPSSTPGGPPLLNFPDVLSWISEAKSRYSLSQTPVSLSTIPQWGIVDGRIVHDEGRYFAIVGVDVSATDREVGSWSQPMLEPVDRGVIGFLVRRINDVVHVLLQARTEAGTRDIVEIGPTVACIPSNYAHLPIELRPRYLDILELATPSSTLVDVVHSEEGGRFLNAENRYLVVDAGDQFELDVPNDYCWLTVGQLAEFVRFGNVVNVAARCLLTCLMGQLEANPETTVAASGRG